MSPELQEQVNRYAKQGVYSLTQALKHEMKKLNPNLNIHCGACLGKELARLSKPAPSPKIQFKAVTHFETVAEMKKEADRRQLSYPKFASRIYMEKLLGL